MTGYLPLWNKPPLQGPCKKSGACLRSLKFSCLETSASLLHVPLLLDASNQMIGILEHY